jgi:hypothetical protein
MTTNGMSLFAAAARLLAFGAMVPFASGITGILLGRLKMRACVVIFVGTALQMVGAALLSQSSTEYPVHASQYGYQILIGFGLGLVMPALIYMLPYTMEKRDLGKTMSVASQCQMY